MNESKISTTALTEEKAPMSDNEKKIRGFIEAVLLTKPDLKDRLSVAATVQYLQLPDSTYGWDAYKEKGKTMPIEYKIACLIPTVINDLSPGSIRWLGNRPYATYDAYKTVAYRECPPISGLKFRPLAPDEKDMYGIGEKDMSIICFQEISFGSHNARTMVIEGLGIIGADESKPNQNGNYKVARELTRDRAQFLRTRAERDMWKRHITIGGVPSEDDYIAPEVTEVPAHDPKKIMEIQSQKSEPLNVEDESEKITTALIVRFDYLSKTITDMGQDPKKLVADFEVPVAIKIMEDWIAAHTPPEPSKPKKSRAKKNTANEVETIEVIPEPEIEVDLLDPNPSVSAENQMDDTPEVQEPILDDFEMPFGEEDPDPIYSGTEAQKSAIRNVVKEVDLPQTQGSLTTLAGAMRGQPMSKLHIKAKAMLENTRPADYVGAVAKPSDEKPATPDQRSRMRGLIEKTIAAQLDINAIVEADAWEIWNTGSFNKITMAIHRLENAYKKYLMSKTK